MTRDTQGVVNIVSKFQLPSSNGLGYTEFEDISTSHDLVNPQTAPATPGLLII